MDNIFTKISDKKKTVPSKIEKEIQGESTVLRNKIEKYLTEGEIKKDTTVVVNLDGDDYIAKAIDSTHLYFIDKKIYDSRLKGGTVTMIPYHVRQIQPDNLSDALYKWLTLQKPFPVGQKFRRTNPFGIV